MEVRLRRLILEPFAGAGGASLGIDRACSDADATVIGIELDEAACRTRAAAGLLTTRADVARFPLAHLLGRVWGLWLSPPCPTFSAAGSGAGASLMDLLAAGMRRVARGDDVRAEVFAACRDRLLTGDKPEKADEHAAMSVLVLEAARWATGLHPEWIACEQVPGVLPLWRVLADELRQVGYATWTGVLDAADYGVPQNRTRAILMARLGMRAVQPPEPTHTDHRRSPSLFLAPHVSMADALGWGMTERPGMTVACGTGGGPDPAGLGGSGARRTIERERERAWRDREPAARPHSDLLGLAPKPNGRAHSEGLDS